MKIKKHVKDIVYFCVILILVLVMLYSGLRILESTVLHTGQGNTETFPSKTIQRGDTAYYPRQDITVVMVLGIDRFGKTEASQSYINEGSADMVTLLVFDETLQVCNVLHLNRDTMLEMPVLGIGGRKAGTAFGQLALSHTYGSGLEDSCENTRETVSEFLYGLKIDYYVSLNMDAIATLNDAVGGVTVEVTEDFSQVDATIGMGQVRLMGQQAVNYVRTRKDVGDQLNVSRVERHRKYVNGFLEALRQKRETEPEFFLEAYESVADYVVTDCSLTILSELVDRSGVYTMGEVLTPEGENRLGEKYYEFHVDEEALDELILRLFYEPKA